MWREHSTVHAHSLHTAVWAGSRYWQWQSGARSGSLEAGTQDQCWPLGHHGAPGCLPLCRLSSISIPFSSLRACPGMHRWQHVPRASAGRRSRYVTHCSSCLLCVRLRAPANSSCVHTASQSEPVMGCKLPGDIHPDTCKMMAFTEAAALRVHMRWLRSELRCPALPPQPSQPTCRHRSPGLWLQQSTQPPALVGDLHGDRWAKKAVATALGILGGSAATTPH